MKEGDVLLYGSYYAACTGMRPLVMQMLENAEKAGAIVYYDLNFRRSHQHELEALTPVILSNFRQSTIVRGSADDFEVMYGERDARRIYAEHIRSYCPIFICTAGAERVTVCTPRGAFDFQVPEVTDVVSTVGAGDNFNAGFSCALIWNGVRREMLPTLDEQGWQQLVSIACQFASEACRSTQNYISPEFAAKVSRPRV
jgi:fructokinase